MFLILSTAASFIAAFADAAMGNAQPLAGAGPIGSVLSLTLLWPSIAVPVKRFHDRGMSGWWVLFPLVSIIGGAVMVVAVSGASLGMGGQAAAASFGLTSLLVLGGVFAILLWQFVVLYCLPGDTGTNDFGPDPRGGSRAAAASAEASELSQARLAALQTARPGGASDAGPAWDFLQPREEAHAAPAAAVASPEKKRNALPQTAEHWGFGRRHASRYRPAR